MSAHIFKVGDVVMYRSAVGAQGGGAYEITRLLPLDAPEPHYRLRSVGQQHERAAKEHELRLVPQVSRLELSDTQSQASRKR